MFARVALPVPFADYFTYGIPPDMVGSVAPGMLVKVPFGNQAATGMIIGLADSTDLPSREIREIAGLGDPELRMPPDLLELVSYVAKRYMTTIGMVLKSALPPGTLHKKKVFFYPGINMVPDELDPVLQEFISGIREEPGRRSYADLPKFPGITRGQMDALIRSAVIAESPFQARRASSLRGKERWLKATVQASPSDTKHGSRSEALLEFLLANPEGCRANELRKKGFSGSAMASLVKRHLAESFFRNRDQDEIGSLKSLVEETAFELTLWQESALQRVTAAIDAHSGKAFLLYGVTSSGKTQVYLEAARHALNRGRSVLVLVPEISLTPQIIARFERFLGQPPLVWHSHLNPTERMIAYKKAGLDRAQIVVGARSAIFCPFNDLGLLVIDEEQDHSYKQDDPVPRYNARDLALERGRLNRAAVLLGSATPSLESYHLAATDRLELLTLPQRVTGKGNPRIEIISTAFKPEPKPNEPPVFPKGFWPISEKLYSEITIRLRKKEQIIILLNRRGYSSAVVCFECGWLGKCPDCEVGWTYHKTRDSMICHFCGKEQKGPIVCGQCGSSRLSFRSAGTQRLEETLRKILPNAKTVRLDSDVATRKWESRDILDDFGRGKYQILLGTQMVAKGHHFPRVGFVAVVNADIGLSLPDFRASERVLQLLTQAAGRAGRSSHKSDLGLVMVQTFSPDQPVFSYLKAHDFTGFLENELGVRQALAYPPFRRLFLVVLSSGKASRAEDGASDLRNEISSIASDKNIEILGPAQSPIFKLGKLYRYQLLLKMPVEMESSELLEIFSDFMKRARGLNVRVDVDPVSFM